MSLKQNRPAVPTNRTVLGIAVPVMISNVSTPLIGVVDTGVVGQIPDPAYIGAVAVGSLIFVFVFWAFGFLRMGTTGLTAQSFGAGDHEEVAASLGRSLALAGIIGLAIVALQWPLQAGAFALLEGSAEVESLARQYFDIRVWAAPATLANYALLGWFIGLGRTDIGLVLQLVLNVTNMLLDAFFVLGLNWDVRGVAAGTLLAEYFAAIVGIVIALAELRRMGARVELARVLDRARTRRTVSVNFDIMIRSLALIFVFVWFMSRGAVQGDVILAANAVLMHFVSVSAYFLDGLAFAAETLVGRSIGAAHRAGLVAAVAITTRWAVVIAAVLAALLVFGGAAGIDVLTVDAAARSAARGYLAWAAFAPLLGVWAFQLDGIFIGATRTREMRNAMLIATGIFLVAWWLLIPYGNHGLWAALYVNYVARIATLAYFYPALVRSVSSEP